MEDGLTSAADADRKGEFILYLWWLKSLDCALMVRTI